MEANLTYEDVFNVLMPAAATREARWSSLVNIYRDAARVPEQMAREIWGDLVLDVMFVSECPSCGEKEDRDNPGQMDRDICGYHRSRQCIDCKGINGTVLSCTCD